jgi:hypothetical protein
MTPDAKPEPVLKPCPHCGSLARRHRYQHDRTRIYFGCESSNCPGNHTFDESKEAEAIGAWNTRAPHPDTERLNKLEKLLSNPKVTIGPPVQASKAWYFFGPEYAQASGDTLRDAIDNLREGK